MVAAVWLLRPTFSRLSSLTGIGCSFFASFLETTLLGEKEKVMSLKGLLLWCVSLVLFVALVAIEAGRLRAAAAEAPAVVPDAPAYTATDDLWTVVDSSETMGPELNALAAAWGGSEAAAIEATYHLVTYTDEVSYAGNTTSAAMYQTWLDNLMTSEGGGCRDDAFRALLSVARETPADGFPDVDALLMTDAEPQGGRRALAFTADVLARRGVRAYPLVTGWCIPFNLPPASMLFLAEATGGVYYTAQAQPMVTVTQMALNQMATTADLARVVGMTTNEEPFTMQFPVDTSMTALSVDSSGTDPCDGWGLTCVVRLRTAPAYTLTVRLQTPAGTVIGPDHPAVTVLETSHRLQMNVDLESLPGPITGTWRLRVSEMGGFRLAVAAHSSLNFDYRGPHVLPAGEPVRVRALLLDDTDGSESARPATGEMVTDAVFTLVGLHGEVGPTVELYDDGEHGDGEAGDGHYGGAIVAPRGFWRLAVHGELADGSSFRRVDPALIRAHRLRVRPPQDESARPGSELNHAFHVTNESEVTQTYELLVSSSMGWAMTGTVPAELTLGPSEEGLVAVPVSVPAGAAIGTVEETLLTVVSQADLSIGSTVGVLTTAADEFPVYLPVALRP